MINHTVSKQRPAQAQSPRNRVYGLRLMDPKPYTLHPTPYTLHPTPYTPEDIGTITHMPPELMDPDGGDACRSSPNPEQIRIQGNLHGT